MAQLRPSALSFDQSATLRNRLLTELAGIKSADELDAWAHRTLALKNTMTPEDARLIEDAYRSRVAAMPDRLGVDQIEAATNPNPLHSVEMRVSAKTPAPVVSSSGSSRASGKTGSAQRRTRTQMIASAERPVAENPSVAIDGETSSPVRETVDRPGIDKSVLALSEPRRYRDREHLRFVATQPCLICERRPSDAHHIRFAQPSALADA